MNLAERVLGNGGTDRDQFRRCPGPFRRDSYLVKRGPRSWCRLCKDPLQLVQPLASSRRDTPWWFVALRKDS